MERFLKYLAVAAITVLFAVMWGVQLREHVVEEYAPSLQPNYDGLLATEEDIRTETWRICFGEIRVGETKVELGRQQDGSIWMDSVTKAEPALANLLGLGEGLDLHFRAEISVLTGLRSFSLYCEAAELEMRGAVEGREIVISGLLGDQKISETLSYGGGDITGTVLSPITAAPRFMPEMGQRWSVRVVDPLTGSVGRIDVTLLEKKEIKLPGGEQPEPVYMLGFVMGTSSWYAWVDGKGQALVQGTPLGVELRRGDLSGAVLAELKLRQRPADE
jgi:hypothetical protein